MERLWGKFAPVPKDRLQVLEDGATTQAGSLRVRAIATPGHASHHHVYHWEENLFGGDVAGVRLGDGPPVPPFVPPELDVEEWLESLEKIRALKAAHLYLPHFGLAAGPVAAHLDALAQRVRRWSDWLGEKIRAGEQAEALTPLFAQYEAEDLRRGGASEEQVADYEAADPSYMAVTAALRYWRKRSSG